MPTDKVDGLIVKSKEGFVRGVSPSAQALEGVIADVSRTDLPVLLVGESGTGKEVFARLIHAMSLHCAEPLIKIVCASATAENFPDELGLNAKNNGNGTQAAVGTVLFDELSELDPGCQRSLLCSLPDGGTGQRRGQLTARLVSTTSRSLDEDVRAGRFRSELYYRINGVCLRLPPLRERKEDIPLFAEFFLTKHAVLLDRPRPSLSPRTLQAFMDHSWPGNIRELENAVRKIVALSDEELAVSEITRAQAGTRASSGETRSHSLKAAARAASRHAERELILGALGRTRWNRKRAAEELRISYKSLLYKLKQIGLEDAETNPQGR